MNYLFDGLVSENSNERMDYQAQINGMHVQGTLYYKILHMPENARYDFLVGVKQMMEDCKGQFSFWKEQWKKRDVKAENMKPPGERFRFMKECCSGDVDHHLWADRWSRIDKGDTNYINAEDRAEHLDYLSQSIPEQKHVSIRRRMKMLGLLKDEPNFNEAAYEEYQSDTQFSRL